MSKEALIKIVFGKRGSGKTIKACNLTRHCNRVLYYDTLGHDYNDGVVIYSLDELRRFWLNVYQSDFRIVFITTKHENDFSQVCQQVASCRNMTFVVEELDLFFLGGRCCQELNDLTFRGRHYDVELVGITQRPKGFGRGLTSQAKEFYVFSTHEPDDVKYFKDRLGGEVAEQIQKLEQFQYVQYLDHGTENKIEIKKDSM